MSNRKTVIWLTGWFPTEANSLSGNFIARHAEVAAQKFDLHVVHFATYKKGTQVPKPVNLNTSYKIHLIPILQSGKKWSKLVDLIKYLFQGYTYLKLLQKHIKAEIIHVHAPDKCGILGAWVSKNFKLPLLLTEHWAIYTNAVPDHFQTRNPWFKYSMRKTWNSSQFCLPVSFNLQKQMQHLFRSEKPFRVLPNVVHSNFINQPIPDLNNQKFIHISNGEPRKNVPIILSAFEHIHREFPNTELIIIGIKQGGHLSFLARDTEGVQFLGNLNPSEISNQLSKASCLILASDAENAPCVIGEAHCVGLPVCSTNVGGIEEMISPENGILFEFQSMETSQRVESLSSIMKQFLMNSSNFNAQKIKEKAVQRYSDSAVLSIFESTYSQF